jgi:hypothetical protein
LEVTHVNSDLANLLSGIEVAVVMIVSDLTIRRFTPQAQKFPGIDRHRYWPAASEHKPGY